MIEYYDAKGAEIIQNQSHYDEAASIFLARELAYIRSKVLEVKKAPLNAESTFQRVYE